MTYGKTFQRKNEICADCGLIIRSGNVRYRYPEKIICHVEGGCDKARARVERRKTMYKLSAHHDCKKFYVLGQVIHITEDSLKDKAYPDYVVVEEVEHNRIVDGFSYGMRVDDGWRSVAYCRAATAEEIEKYRAAKKEAAERREIEIRAAAPDGDMR